MFITQESPVLRSLEKRIDNRRCHCAGNVTANHGKHTKESASICVHLRSMNSPCQLQRCVYTWDARSPPNDLSSATRPTGRVNCNLNAMAGFAAAQVSRLI